MKFITKNENEVLDVAKYVLDNLTPSKIILLNGDLGAGKTTLVKKIAKILQIKDIITSPTFNYMKNYDGLIHIDAYHLNGDLSEFEDYYEQNVVCIEWPEKIEHNYSNYLKINIIVDVNNNHIYNIKEVK
ncbi:tRNA (adenosine(37)-N6)-threonylcarbamoyltransferase complex ATPase subunit type 1 TsaE [Mycoplasmopsis lipofaciens]|uniref:tRNA (adenosine(37)-N6)-threonylcarbamoyltransferase complex ATPase subunit type 1 TsaE n=1 Tax=Mycoplasmopsis lipofaciens TaxID=114884 RepID=UPI00047FDC6D|nr:tRNA (adenosine(37)-N6)-threonylcarbamoyltransferase complex ATPase subunit type 1 TsaE [Mycoplasmopsis lipofaciens]